MPDIVQQIAASYKKTAVVNVRSGDTVKVHQKIREGNKERVQVFQGLVIRTDSKNSHLSRITVRRIASGIGVEKSFLMHSPLIVKVEVVKRSKVRRNYLSYMRNLTGKSARLSGIEFDRSAVNELPKEEEPILVEINDDAQTEAPIKDPGQVDATSELATKE
jgi:large subunit ribosomal protein L19